MGVQRNGLGSVTNRPGLYHQRQYTLPAEALSSTLQLKVDLLVGPVPILKELALEVRPELFMDLRKRIRAHLRIKPLDVIAQLALSRIVGIADSRADGVAGHLAEVESPLPF